MDLYIAWLAQFGQREDLLKMDMARFSHSGWALYCTPKLKAAPPPKSSPRSMPRVFKLKLPEWRVSCRMTISYIYPAA